jgi:hypothetical protein
MASPYSNKAKLEEVLLDNYALDAHYRKFKEGFRYSLAVQCYQYVEQKAQQGNPVAMKIQAGVF